MDFSGKQVAVIGYGKSGKAALELLGKLGAKRILYDQKLDCNAPGIDAEVLVFGDFKEEGWDDVDCAVFSPGVPVFEKIGDFFRSKNIPIIGEIELGYLVEKGSVMAITGTNGKTTTTTLVGEIMKAFNEKTFVVGNIGNPYTSEAAKTSEDSVTVAEISSFQLESTVSFCPKVSAILNITPDHLNRHGTMEKYAETKLSITKNQTKEQFCILNYEDERLRNAADSLPCQVEFFSSQQKIANGMYKDASGNLVRSRDGKVLLNQKEPKLPGDHNAENIMAALLMVEKMGVPDDVAVEVTRHFHPVEHRVEYVTTINGVEYYNDSKGTNPDAAIKGIQSMDRPTILIGGGYDKGGSFSGWIRSFDGKVKCLLLLGDTKDRIAQEAEECGFFEYRFVDSLEEAVKTAHDLAESGDAVLLSPACASWDMFDSYEQRGTMFKDFVRGLE